MNARFEALSITKTAAPIKNNALKQTSNGAALRTVESVTVQPTPEPDSVQDLLQSQESTCNQAPQSVFERLYHRETVASMKFKERIDKDQGSRSPKFTNSCSLETPRSVIGRLSRTGALSTSKKRPLQQASRGHFSKKVRSLEVKNWNPQTPSGANVVSEDSGEANATSSPIAFPRATRCLESAFTSECITPAARRTPPQFSPDRPAEKPGSQSFFDRLASTDTYASAKLKERKPVVKVETTPAKPQPLYSKSLRRPLGAPVSVHERLANANTASSRGWQTSPYRSPVPMNINTAGLKKPNLHTNDSGSVFFDALGTNNTTSVATQRCRNPRPRNDFRIKLVWSDKNNPEHGFMNLSPHEIGLNGHLHMYEAGDLTSNGIARSIMEALFHRDFKAGKHWDVECAIVHRLKQDDEEDSVGPAYAAEKNAIWDRVDVCNTAQAKGVIRIMPGSEEIRIENYSFVVS